jgi:hypothetical protein
MEPTDMAFCSTVSLGSFGASWTSPPSFMEIKVIGCSTFHIIYSICYFLLIIFKNKLVNDK